jgi:hypothetical protein
MSYVRRFCPFNLHRGTSDFMYVRIRHVWRRLLKKVNMDIAEVPKNSLPCSNLGCIRVQVKVPTVGPLPTSCNPKWMENHPGQCEQFQARCQMHCAHFNARQFVHDVCQQKARASPTASWGPSGRTAFPLVTRPITKELWLPRSRSTPQSCECKSWNWKCWWKSEGYRNQIYFYYLHNFYKV